MSVVVRYFSTAAAGAGDGTSWADRAALLNGSGQVSTVLASLDPSGADAIECRIGPGTYSASQHLNDARFAGAPTRANPMIWVGVDSNGDPLTPPDPAWTAAQPAWDDSEMPFIDNTASIGGDHWIMRMLKIRSAWSEPIKGTPKLDWCIVEGTGTGSGTIVAEGYLQNCVVKCSAAAYEAVVSVTTNGSMHNVRAEGNPSATTGTRHGIIGEGNGRTVFDRCVAVNNPGGGIVLPGDGSNKVMAASRCVAYGNGSHGFDAQSTNATAADLHRLMGCVAVGNGGYGVSVGTGPGLVLGGRYRNNTSGVSNGLGHGGVFGSETGAGIDADEFVDAAGGDLRIKNTSALWGRGIGAGDEPAASGGGSAGTRGYWG